QNAVHVLHVATALRAVFIMKLKQSAWTGQRPGGYRRVPLVLRERELQNHTPVDQGDKVQTTPAKSTASAPINLIAKDVRNRYPEQAGNDKQIGKHRHEQAAHLIAQKGRIK